MKFYLIGKVLFLRVDGFLDWSLVCFYALFSDLAIRLIFSKTRKKTNKYSFLSYFTRILMFSPLIYMCLWRVSNLLMNSSFWKPFKIQCKWICIFLLHLYSIKSGSILMSVYVCILNLVNILHGLDGRIIDLVYFGCKE